MALTDAVAQATRSVVALSSSVILAALGSTGIAPASSAAPPTCGETFSGGAGTTADPFLISSAADFTALNGDEYCWSKVFLQTTNIDMGGITWNIPGGTPASTTGTDAVPFSGIYDGSEYTISNLKIYVSDDNPSGLFGVVTGNIRNVRFDTSLGVYGGYNYVGGLVGYLDGGTVSNSSSTAPVEADNAWAGGLVGYAAAGSSIDASFSSGSVKASDSNAEAGGLVGENFGSISDSYATGTVEAGTNDDYIGGLVGSNAGSVSDSYATGTVLTDGGEYIGGLIGFNSGTVSGSYATGTVKHDTGDNPGVDVGGLIGLQEQDARVTNSYATGTVTGRNYVGGLIGRMGSGSSVSGSYATGSVTRAGTGDDKDIGGLVGYNNSGSITNCYATGSVTGGNAGGLVGVNAGTVANCYSTGTVTGDSTGGLVQDNTGTVSNSFWDLQTSGVATSNGGTGKTTSEMKTLTTFTDASWSITESCSSTAVWGLCTTRNSGYPYLTFYTAPPTPRDVYVSFTFSLPDGQECGPISPMAALAGVWVALPPATADCTVDDAAIIGWSVRGMDGYFQPGQQVLAVGAQQFTAVLSHSRVAVTSDANVAADDACMTADGNTELDQRVLIEEPGRDSLGDYRAPLAPTCTPQGVTFAGWDYRRAGVVLAPGDALPAIPSATNTVHLYAVWV